MKVKQIVEAEFHHVYIGWNNIQFSDLNANEVRIEISDDQLLALSDKLLKKATEIRKDREPVEEELVDE